MLAQNDDVVLFNSQAAGHATLDVEVGAIKSLEITNWRDTLTLNHTLSVAGSGGDFLFTDPFSTIRMVHPNPGNPAALDVGLELLDLGMPGTNLWTGGTITGGDRTFFAVHGSQLLVSQAPGNLGTSLYIEKSLATDNNGFVTLFDMTTNLTLNGTDNSIYVGAGGFLKLNQLIDTAGQENTRGGIDFTGGHTGTLAVQVGPGGTLERFSFPVPGVLNQVKIAGAVYNLGGTVDINSGGMLNITGRDAANRSYWQKTVADAILKVDSRSNINAAGTYEIEIGEVRLTAPSGDSAELLGGAGLIFSGANPTTLRIVDSTFGTPGTVAVQGPVILGQNTTTRMNYNGANNTADRLEVRNGALTLNGTLRLQSSDGRTKPTQPLDFFADVAATPSIVGAFTSITGDLSGVYSGEVISESEFQLFYRVTIT